MLRTRSARRPLLALAALGTLLVLTLGGLGATAAQADPTGTAPTATSTVQPGDRPDSQEGSSFPWVRLVIIVAAAGLVTVAVIGARTRRAMNRPDGDRRPPADR
ncbi:hypothetical protein GCM10023221_26060 [Luteimicrobium xylanilyticum]|uniref:Uncharacterized protein n=1 Tax=Luteimicrobium xylanilyticum TaxID=1133546 RepID=A0A5P9QE39_9MICO|nr:hypothetical protein [Luteimicrobium xylanilyticum]QFU99731.1 hypothetical protein KDY119_03266 [Luteimicrobium xylanilyticum]